ncbi:MAG: hypothetical protein IJ146_00795 [Kiritimatiellae bacterium]|nr:hypothetical protein [Kiritimatiellia bacterium]
MKMNLAVYTAQEGYSWQPGTALTAEDLGKFKKAIGRFPSADAADFPFGGVLKVDGRVVFYRYHVAKKIDFCGRDALYCVLGAVPFADAAKIDPATLFALPEFAGPMKPFPVALEVPEADSASVPDWLKNLDARTLDVRITGPAENPSYAVEQNTIELQQTPAEDAAFDGMAHSPSAPQCSVPDPPTSATDGRGARPARPQPNWVLWLGASLAMFALIGAITAITLGIIARKKNGQATSSDKPDSTNNVSVVIATIPSNTAVSVAAETSKTNVAVKAAVPTNAITTATDKVTTATSKPIADTNKKSIAAKSSALAATNATKSVENVPPSAKNTGTNASAKPVQKSAPAVKPPVQTPVQAAPVGKPKPTPSASNSKPQASAAKQPTPVVQKGNSSSKENGTAHR